MRFKLFLLFPFFSLFQRIRLPEYDITFIPTKQNEIRTISTNDNRFVKIHLYNAKGKMDLEYYNADSSLLEKGSYVESIELLKAYSIGISATTQKRQMEVVTYFQPLRHGKWEFFKSGKLEYYLTYNKGIKIDSVSVFGTAQ